MNRKSAWTKYDGASMNSINAFAREYRGFIDHCKTERECAAELVKTAKAAGYADLEQIVREHRPLKPGDRVLLCSDGLFKTLSLQEINSIIASSQGCSAQDELLRAVLAKDKRKQDNVTLVMLYCDPV